MTSITATSRGQIIWNSSPDLHWRCRVYHRLESLSSDADEVQVAHDLAEMLGEDKMCYLQLVHQLIVCEELLKDE